MKSGAFNLRVRSGQASTPPAQAPRSASPAASAADETAESLTDLVRRARRLLGASGAALIRADGDGFRIETAAGGFEPLRGRRYPTLDARTDPLLASEMTVINGSAVSPFLEMTGAERLLVTPVRSPSDQWVSLLVAATAERPPFGRKEMRWAASLAERIGHKLEIRALHERIARLERELEGGRRARQRFFSSSSHELRTPLNAVLCYNDLLLHRVLGPLNHQQASAAERMGTAIRHLKRLLDDLFHLSELEAGLITTTSTATDLHALAHDVARALAASTASNADITVEGEDPFRGRLETDGRKVRRILLLIGEAALTLSETANVILRIHADDVARLELRCPHLAPDPELLRGLEDETGMPTDASSAGLALAIARRMAELLDGRVTIAASEDGGSVFTLELPVRVATPIP